MGFSAYVGVSALFENQFDVFFFGVPLQVTVQVPTGQLHVVLFLGAVIKGGLGQNFADSLT